MRAERWREESCKKRGRGVKQTANKGAKEEIWGKKYLEEGEKIQVRKMRWMVKKKA